MANRLQTRLTKLSHIPGRPDRTSHLGKIIRIDTKTIRAAGRATMGVKLLDLDDADKVAAAVTIPPEEVKPEGEDKALIQ